MKKSIALILVLLMLFSLLISFSISVFADEENTNEIVNETLLSTSESQTNVNNDEAPISNESADDSTTKTKAIAAAAMIAIVAGIGAYAMSKSINKASDGIARQPEASGEIRTNVMLGLVFIETAIIYALIVAILIIFVL